MRPGIYDMTAAEYHADPVPGGSLSSTIARAMLPPSCPDRARWLTQHRRPDTTAFDEGHAAHTLVLGRGEQLQVIRDATDWRTKAARDARDEARAAGRVPLLGEQYQRVRAMADAVLTDPVAGCLFSPDSFAPERAYLWPDEQTGVACRAMIDAAPTRNDGIYVDLKTTQSADPGQIARSVYKHKYHVQAAFYTLGIEALTGQPPQAFLFVFVEKQPPHPVTVVELDEPTRESGMRLARRALRRWEQCTRLDMWPGHADDVKLVSLAPWALATADDVLAWDAADMAIDMNEDDGW